MHDGSEGLHRARRLLADDLEYVDPLMTARNADDLIRQIGQSGGGDVVTENEKITSIRSIYDPRPFFEMGG